MNRSALCRSESALANAQAEIARLRSWMYEAINSLGDPQDACDHNDSEEEALRATIDEAMGKLQTGLGDADQQHGKDSHGGGE